MGDTRGAVCVGLTTPLRPQPEEVAQEAVEEPLVEPLLEPEGENYEEPPQVRGHCGWRGCAQPCSLEGKLAWGWGAQGLRAPGKLSHRLFLCPPRRRNTRSTSQRHNGPPSLPLPPAAQRTAGSPLLLPSQPWPVPACRGGAGVPLPRSLTSSSSSSVPRDRVRVSVPCLAVRNPLCPSPGAPARARAVGAARRGRCACVCACVCARRARVYRPVSLPAP